MLIELNLIEPLYIDGAAVLMSRLDYDRLIAIVDRTENKLKQLKDEYEMTSNPEQKMYYIEALEFVLGHE